MPVSRRNLIVIVSLCIVAIYLAASVRVYRSVSGLSSKNSPFALQYAPFKLPEGPEKAFYEAIRADRLSKAVERTISVSKSYITGKPAQPTPAPTPTPQSIPVGAKAYIVADISSGKIYFEKNSKTSLPVASMSKLITAFVAADSIPLDTEVAITDAEAALPPDTSHLMSGEKISMNLLMYPLLLSSSNVAAEAVASASGHRNNFLELMSSYAWEIGMSSTYFADASGLSPQNAASARDLFALARYLYNSRPDILAITRTPQFYIATTTEHGSHEVVSTHPFVNDPNFIGGKTGRTPEAGETMMTLMKVNGRPIAVVVLGSVLGGREIDTRVLIEKVKEVI
jgi:D-alanyl-D-alanine carboxypeptidase